jgi:hypothetical protein
MKKNRLSKITIFLLLAVIVVIGFFLRLYKLGDSPLWSDEAEIVIGARQILTDGYLSGYYKGEPLFENYLATPAPVSDQKYAFEDINLAGLKYQVNKGWLTYYLIAGVVKIFGFSNFNVRLPFVLISLLTIFIIYLLSKDLYGKKIALWSSFFYAINVPLIIHERMCRYYSLFIFLVVLNLFLFNRLCRKDEKKYHYLLILSLVLLFYTHLVAFLATGIFMIIYWFWHEKKKLNRQLVMDFIIVIFLTVPWMVWVNFFLIIRRQSSVELKVILILLGFLFIFAGYFIRYLNKVIFKKKYSFNFNLTYLGYFNLLYFFISSLLVPEESFQFRLWFPILATTNILVTFYLISFLKEFKIKYIFYFLIILLLNIFLVHEFVINSRELYHPYWINRAVQYLKENRVSSDVPIFVKNHYQALNVYLPNKVMLVDSLRKEYLERFPGEYYLFLYRPDICIYKNTKNCKLEDYPYVNLIKICDKKVISSDLIAYHCSF